MCRISYRVVLASTVINHLKRKFSGLLTAVRPHTKPVTIKQSLDEHKTATPGQKITRLPVQTQLHFHWQVISTGVDMIGNHRVTVPKSRLDDMH